MGAAPNTVVECVEVPSTVHKMTVKWRKKISWRNFPLAMGESERGREDIVDCRMCNHCMETWPEPRVNEKGKSHASEMGDFFS
jgi:hypothetical protein